MEMPAEGIRVKVKLSELDKQRVAIEFNKLAGSSVYFREQLAWMKAALNDYTDATLEEVSAE